MILTADRWTVSFPSYMTRWQPPPHHRSSRTRLHVSFVRPRRINWESTTVGVMYTYMLRVYPPRLRSIG